MLFTQHQVEYSVLPEIVYSAVGQKREYRKCPHCLYLSEWVTAKSNQKEVPWENANLILQETQVSPCLILGRFYSFDKMTKLTQGFQGTLVFKFLSQKINRSLVDSQRFIEWKWISAQWSVVISGMLFGVRQTPFLPVGKWQSWVKDESKMNCLLSHKSSSSESEE